MKRWFPWIVAAIVVTLLAILFGYQGYFQSLQDKDPISLQESITWQLKWWYIWLGLAPLILLLAKKFPVTRPGGPKNLAIHIPVAIGLSFTHTTTQTFLNWCAEAVAGKPGEGFWNMVMKMGISEQLQLGFFFYAIIVAIASAMNYYKIYEQEELKASQLEAELSQTQFQAMKMQVYPHFLFNTLSEITRLMKKDVDEADRMIARLGDFLRLSIENIGTQVVALQRELNFLKCYLEIERIRTQNRLSFDLDVDPDSMDAQVPNLLLQPLIESAVTQMRNLPAHVQISARRENGHLRVEITDNCGVDTSSAENEPLAEMRIRLRQIYGEAFYLDAARSPDGRNAVTLEIPV